MSGSARLPIIEHAGLLEDIDGMPGYLAPDHVARDRHGAVSCSYCGVGDGGHLEVISRPERQQGARVLRSSSAKVRRAAPTTGCVKLRTSSMRQRAAFPIHTAPTVLDEAGERRTISYEEAINRLADALLQHRGSHGKTLVYASGQIDYFTIFAMQEVLRLLGIRNLTGNAEHCLNSGAVHNEVLTGQEGPFLTIEQSVNGPDRAFILNGWNGFISHPPVYRALMKRKPLVGWLIEVMVTETAKGLAKRLGPERIVLIRPGTDPHLALAVGHQLLSHHASAIDHRFIERFSDGQSFEPFAALAKSQDFAPEVVAERIAPEPRYQQRILTAIQEMAATFAKPHIIPINLPSVGLSQTTGVVAHCVWGSVLAMLGKYGLRPDGTPAGGTLRVPGQINAESEVQGLSRKYFMGRIPMKQADEAAERMGLPAGAYQTALEDPPRAALDYSDPNPGVKELFICVGTQFEANMMGRHRWLDKLNHPDTTLIVIDPIPDPYSLKAADLILPSPPHPAAAKLYQNGEWRLTLSVPQKQASAQTRSDATILYDAMAVITRKLRDDPDIAAKHADLIPHLESGYLQRRFCPPTELDQGLTRVEGEVSRPELWDRVMTYMSGGCGPLYCRPEHADGRAVTWSELLTEGSVVYGGVGETRFVLDYDDLHSAPFRDIFGKPCGFRFFRPTDFDLRVPSGIILNSGRSTVSDDRNRIRFAIGTFNSGKATPIVGMPDEHPLFLSPHLAKKIGLSTGDIARVTNRHTGISICVPVEVSKRVKGDSVYMSFHKSRAQLERGVYINDITNHEPRCPYSGQTRLKVTEVVLERVV